MTKRYDFHCNLRFLRSKTAKKIWPRGRNVTGVNKLDFALKSATHSYGRDTCSGELVYHMLYTT
jgi:hypothetical protein